MQKCWSLVGEQKKLNWMRCLKQLQKMSKRIFRADQVFQGHPGWSFMVRRQESQLRSMLFWDLQALANSMIFNGLKPPWKNLKKQLLCDIQAISYSLPSLENIRKLGSNIIQNIWEETVRVFKKNTYTILAFKATFISIQGDIRNKDFFLTKTLKFWSFITPKCTQSGGKQIG